MAPTSPSPDSPNRPGRASGKKASGWNLYTFTEGDGKLTLTAGVNTYANWLAANPPATGFNTDTDNDGVPNGVENVLGTDPNVYSAGMTDISSTASSATYQHTLSTTVAGDVSYTYEWSTDLVEWKASGGTNAGTTTATITPSAPASGVVTVVTAITSGPAAKLFTRIKAQQLTLMPGALVFHEERGHVRPRSFLSRLL